MTSIVVFGAYSAIGAATARRLTQRHPGARFVLVGRKAERLRACADDLAHRGAGSVEEIAADLADLDRLGPLVEEVVRRLGQIDIALITHGTLPQHDAIRDDWSKTLEAVRVNALSPIALLCALAPHFERQRQGTIAAVTSVAGDRGRQSNYVYGAAKRAVSTYLEGLRHRLGPLNVHVVDIRPGFVDTPMTKDIQKGALWATPQQAAQGVDMAIARRRGVSYVPFFWRAIMLIVRLLPDWIFKRVRL